MIPSEEVEVFNNVTNETDNGRLEMQSDDYVAFILTPDGYNSIS
ncbi:hypothetical protein RU98_GL000477 [Enterococcus caccae]|nr:hypothetical protein RU98_GL000477 [Enterococcus caccae]